MAFWLTLFGGALLVMGIIVAILIVLGMTVMEAACAANNPSAEGAGFWLTMSALSLSIAALYAGLLLVMGALLNVGGRALTYMDHGGPPRRRQTRRRGPTQIHPRVERGDAPVRRRMRR